LPKEDILSFALVCREWSPVALTYLLRQHPFRSDKELLWFIVSRSNSDTFISKQYQGLLTELDLTAAHSLYYDLGVMGTVECQYENPLTSLLDLQLEALAKGSNLYCLKVNIIIIDFYYVFFMFYFFYFILFYFILLFFFMDIIFFPYYK